jgi:hypothetical protein
MQRELLKLFKVYWIKLFCKLIKNEKHGSSGEVELIERYKDVTEAIEFLKLLMEIEGLVKRYAEIAEEEKNLNLEKYSADLDALKGWQGSNALWKRKMDEITERLNELKARGRTFREGQNIHIHRIFKMINLYNVQEVEDELSRMVTIRNKYDLMSRFKKAKQQTPDSNESPAGFYRRMESEFDSLSAEFKKIQGHTDAVLKVVECDNLALEFSTKSRNLN